MGRVEIAAGIILGLLFFFYLQGYDILPVLFLVGLIGAIIYMSAFRLGGKSFVAVGPESREQGLVSFDDIGGQETAKKELREALDFIRDVERIKSLGIRPIKGILLNGPPGTGKTLLAKAAAQFTNSAFVAASGSEFVEMYVGVGAQRVRQLFKQAKNLARKYKKQSAVIFIDEIEVLCGKRGQSANHTEYDQTLNELLVQMDGLSIEDDVRILVIGATNRLDILDPAILRPGRFDRQVRVELPDKKGRLSILQLHTRNKPLAEGIDLEQIAADTFGFSGAHLESVANEAAIMALREEADKITQIHLAGAVEKVIMGERLDRLPGVEEKRRIAVHEAGHAILSELTNPGSVASVNVAVRGNALGYVRHTQQEDMYLYTADYVKNQIAAALAGAVAEEAVFGSRSTGAANDFKQAASLAKQMIFGGMSELGIVSPEDMPKEVLHRTLTGLLRDVETAVRATVEEYRPVLDMVAERLLEKETLAGEEIRAILRDADAERCA